MVEQHQVTVHTRRRSDATSVPLPFDSDQQLVLQSLVRPRDKPHKVHTFSPWEKHEPIEQTPNTRAWINTIPEALKKNKLRPPSRPPTPTDWDNVSPFQHWVPHPPSRVESPKLQQTFAVKRSIDGKATVGAWAAVPVEEHAGEGGAVPPKEEKRVRVESPATTLNRTTTTQKSPTTAGAKPRRSPRKPETSTVDERLVRRSSRTRTPTAKELVPATPEATTPAEAPELAIGAIERCIPPPYHHEVNRDHALTNYPTRQKPSRVLHSFVDPAYSRAQTDSSASLVRPGGQDIAATSPKTSQFLIPGRQGSWLIPVSGPFPIPEASPPVWYSRPPPPISAVKPSNRPLQKTVTSIPPPPIQWTSSRLAALWSFLSELNKTSSFGPLRAACYLVSNQSSNQQQQLPEYIKITLDANLALAFRPLLSLISVAFCARNKAAGGGASGKKGKLVGRDKLKEKETNVEGHGFQGAESKFEEDEKDGEKWLNGKSLIWVDESGRAILVA